MTGKEKTEVLAHRLARAKETLNEAQLLFNNNFFNAAVNRIYYSCFYAVGTLLINSNIKARKHSGAIKMFSLHFVLPGIVSKETGKFYSELFDMRQSGDYVDYFDFLKDDVAPLFLPAQQLITKVEEILSRQQ